MNITIITVGKLKEKYLKEALNEYTKRLSKYCILNIVEIEDEKAPESLSLKEEEQIKQKEGEGILKHIKDNQFVIALVIQGKMLTSEELASLIEEKTITGTSHITFVIGGSLGLSKDVIERSNYKLSFSKFTFPHQLMRVILAEQIYRSFRIIKGEPYHK